ncbi:hypothetical protein [Mycolicibacterium sp. CBMA 226]|uniref:hypothetical protein n=1 Tax=Mycolicibacterium sp. CBMA 226 TaxID=2606611 RepID=UPI0012DE7962|nr:hypothetical protein [Mycolicibacterium sp. CBMA 226]MUL76169.1 hypothetical protein [Mycolicibacterium sp. CBMA 226]
MALLMIITVAIGGHRIEFKIFDGYLILIMSVAALAVDSVNQGMLAEMVVRWLIPYFAIRILAPAAGIRFTIDAISIILAIVGGLAVIEFFFSWHPFVNWSVGWNAKSIEFQTWHQIQTRAGSDRSTWAFGHAIALGGSLSLSIPLIARATFRNAWKVTMFVAVGAGIITSGSRSALLAAALTGGLTIAYTARELANRILAMLIAAATALLIGPQVLPVFQEWAAGASTEEQGSAYFRSYLYELYLPKIQWFGRSPDFFNGTALTDSIDSALLYIGVNWGWIITGIIVFPLLVVVMRVAAGRASAPEIALAGQIPLFLTVALLTQYESLIFIFAGLAVQFTKTTKTEETKPQEASGHVDIRGDSISIVQATHANAAYRYGSRQ